MRRKSEKNEKRMIFLEPSMGLLQNLGNPNEMENVINVGYIDTLQGNVLDHILLMEIMLCNKPT